jgi:hypothetical protein
MVAALSGFLYFGFRCVATLCAIVDDINSEIAPREKLSCFGISLIRAFWIHEKMFPDDDYLLRDAAARFFHRTVGATVFLTLALLSKPLFFE